MSGAVGNAINFFSSFHFWMKRATKATMADVMPSATSVTHRTAKDSLKAIIAPKTAVSIISHSVPGQAAMEKTV